MTTALLMLLLIVMLGASMMYTSASPLSTNDFEAILNSEAAKELGGGLGAGGGMGEGHNALLEQIIKDKADDEIIEINHNDQIKKVRVGDLRDYLNKQKKMFSGMQRDKDGSVYKEETGRVTVDEIEKGDDKNLQLFMMLGRVGHQMMLRQGHGYPVLSNLVSSPRQENDMQANSLSYPNLLIITTTQDDREKSFELEFDLDSDKYDHPGFAIINAWTVDKSEERNRLRKIEGIEKPQPPRKLWGLKLEEIEALISYGKFVGAAFIAIGLISLYKSKDDKQKKE